MPQLKGLVKLVIPCAYTKNAQFFGGIFSSPQEGRICAAISDVVPLLGTPEKAGVM